MPMSLVRNRPTAELRSLVRRLGGTWSGDTAMCACPAHADRTPSLSIRQGDRGILVTCHAGCDASDVLRELSRIERLPDFRRVAIEKARSGPGDAYMAIWRAANAIEGTIAERYIRDTRGIWVPLNDLRFHPRCPRGQGTFARFEPALLVAMRKLGEIAAIQRIFLDPGTATWTEKLCLGQAIGAAWTNGPPARSTPAPGDDRDALGRCRTGHGDLGAAGRLHDQGPSAATGNGGSGQEAGLILSHADASPRRRGPQPVCFDGS